VEDLLVADGGRRVTLIERPGLPEVLELVEVEADSKGKKGSNSAPVLTLRAVRAERLSPGLLSLAMAQKRGWLATGAWDGTAKIWNIESRGELRSLTSGGKRIWDVTFNHRETRLATALDDGKVTVWDPDTGRALRTFDAHTKAVRRVAFSPDDRTIVTAGWDNAIKLWEADNGRLLATLSGHTRPVNAVAFAPSGQQVASGASDGTVRLWSSAGAPAQTLRGHTRSVRDVTFSPDGMLLASAGADRTARIWDLRTARVRATLLHPATVWSVAFDNNGQNLVTSSQDGSTRVWDVASGRATALLREANVPTAASINEAFFSEDGERVVTVSSDDTLRWWSLKTQREVARIWGHATNAASASLAADRTGTRLALVDSSGMVRLVNATTETTLRSFQTGQGEVGAAGFSPDGKVLATLGAKPTLMFWEVETGKALESMTSPEGTFDVLAFDSTGARVAGAGMNAAPVVWTRGASPLVLADPRAVITGLSFSPAGDLLAGVSRDGRVFVWSVKTGFLIGDAPGGRRTEIVSTLDVAFSADGSEVRVVSSLLGLETLRTDAVYEADTSRLMASAFEQLPPMGSPLHRGIAEALRGQISTAVTTIGTLKDPRERQTAERLKLLEHLQQGTLTAAVLSDYFGSNGAIR
jgi:WD40 repeat protein